MWGWAWISFSSDYVYFWIDISQWQWKLSINVDNDIQLEKFKMVWYDDWMDNIKGSFLKAIVETNFYIDEIQNVIDRIISEFKKDQELDESEIVKFYNIQLEYKTELNDMIFGWYVRWNIEWDLKLDADTELTSHVYVCLEYKWKYYDIEVEWKEYELFEDVTVKFTKENEEEFNEMYNAIFNYQIDEDDDNDFYFDDIRNTYGA